VGLHAETPVEDPDKGDEPAVRGVGANRLPAEDEVDGEGGAGDEGGEEHEDKGDGVEEGLEDGDLGGDAHGLHLVEGAGAGRSPAASHDVWDMMLDWSAYGGGLL
jgi:hypothetical protein